VTVEVNNPTDELLPAEHKPAVGQVAASGLVWMFGQSVASKVVSTGSQIVLGWLLVERDFGRIGLALTVYSFPALLQQAGLRDVLTQRQDRFRELSSPAFWMGLCSGILAGLIMLAAAPLAQRAYQKEIVGLVMLLALSAPFESLATVPYAKLQSEMRFRSLAMIYLINIVANAALSIFFAWRGFGPYSIILPKPILAFAQAAVLLPWTRPTVRLNFEVHLWKYLLGPLSMLLAVSLCNTLVSQADYMALGLFHTEQVVGVYFFAFGIALQTLRLVAGSVSSVLFPALSRFHENREHQVQVAMRTVRIMGCVSIPAMLLQAAVARPVLNLLFHHKWDDAVPIVQILSVGFALDAMNWVAGSLLQAQGRFRLYLALNVGSAILFLSVVLFAAYFYAAVGVSVAVAVCYILLSPAFLTMTFSRSGVRLATILQMYVRPLLIGCATAGCAVLAAQLIRGSGAVRDIGRIALVALVATVVYIPLLKTFTPDVWGELLRRAVQLLGRTTRGFPVQPT
jgi:O-antigen/teichoic acid export membrane protein